MTTKPKLLYISPRHSTFVQKDVRLLSEKFDVHWMFGNVTGLGSLILFLARQVVHLLTHRYEGYLVMFAGHHSVLPLVLAKVTGKFGVVILGGMDSVSFPEYGYGNFRKASLKWSTTISLRVSKAIIPVSTALASQDYRYVENAPSKQGFLHFVPNLKSVIIPIANGYDDQQWFPAPTMPSVSFLTVATHVETEARKKIKGIDLFLELAQQFPSYTFTLGGVEARELENCPANVYATGNLDQAQLLALYQNHTHYLQLSISEGFPNALCEAMLCGCVPIVSHVGGMPEIVDQVGYVLNKKELGLAIKILQMAIQEHSETQRELSRARISNHFSELRRKEKLVRLIQEALKER